MFIPIGDDNSRRTLTPYITWGLIATNAVMWWIQLVGGETFTYGYSTIPFEITHGVDLVTPKIASVGLERIPVPQAPGPHPISLTLLSSMFMHGSWEHIIGNMVYLLIFGDQIEDLLGHLRFFFFYLFCGFAASAAHILSDPSSVIPSLGASGAIAGVLGAYLIRFPSNRVSVIVGRGRISQVPAMIVLGAWIVLQLISQVTVFAGAPAGVAYMAHIGGFLAGAALILLLPGKRSAGSTRVAEPW